VKYTDEGTMKLRIVFVFLIGSCLSMSACAQEKTELRTVKEKASYALGQQMVGNLVQVASEIDQESFIQGIRDALDNTTPLIDRQAGAEALEEYESVLQNAMVAHQNAESEKNLKAAKDFLEKNKTKPEVTVTESGLQYEVLREGAGARPKASDVVRVHYRGTLLNGTEFDSSYSRGEPVSFPLNQVIPGWTEGVQLMNAGAKYKFYIPPELGYGPRGAGDSIGPNEALIFEVAPILILLTPNIGLRKQRFSI
jgi:FKBP-type peptidyl-prolyl cis-trans isomerase FkpA